MKTVNSLFIFLVVIFFFQFSSPVVAQIPQGFATDNGYQKIGPNPASIAKIDRSNFSYSGYVGDSSDFTLPFFPNKSFKLSDAGDGVPTEYDMQWDKGKTSYVNTNYVQGFSWLSIGAGQSVYYEKFTGGLQLATSSSSAGSDGSDEGGGDGGAEEPGAHDAEPTGDEPGIAEAVAGDDAGAGNVTTVSTNYGTLNHTLAESRFYLGLPLTYVLLGAQIRQINEEFEYLDETQTLSDGVTLGVDRKTYTAQYNVLDLGMISSGLLPGLDLAYIHRPKVTGTLEVIGTDIIASDGLLTTGADLTYNFTRPSFTSYGVAYAFGGDNFGFQFATESGTYGKDDSSAGTGGAAQIGRTFHSLTGTLPRFEGTASQAKEALSGKMGRLQLGDFLDIKVSNQKQTIGGLSFERKATTLNFPFTNSYTMEFAVQEFKASDKNGKTLYSFPFATVFFNMRFGSKSSNSTGRCGIAPKTKSIGFYEKMVIKACQD